MKQRIIRFEPAYDRRDPDPLKNYGIHGVNLLFVLKGEKGAVQFLLFTNWYLPHVRDELEAKRTDWTLFRPMPADLGYHSKIRLHEWNDEKPQFDDCEWTEGNCWYDGSGLNAEPVFQRLLREGDSGIWAALEDYYTSTFEQEAVTA